MGIWNGKADGPLDKFFDFNKDGKLNTFERGMEYRFMNEIRNQNSQIMKIVVPGITTMRKTMIGTIVRIMARVIATTIKLTTMTITMANKMVEVIQP